MLRHYFLDADNATLHALIEPKRGYDNQWAHLGSSDLKPALIGPVFLRNIHQDPNDYILEIQQPLEPDHALSQPLPKPDP